MALWAVVAVLVVAALLNPAPRDVNRPPENASARTHLDPGSSPTSASPATSVTPAASATPTRLHIPSIGVNANVVGLGLEKDKTVQVPQDPDEAGWFNQGPQPGTNGSSVILGHVDSLSGPAVFYRLRELVPGNQVQVRLSDGSLVTFQVTRVATYANADFPAQRVYAGTPGRPTLNIVTCGGEYDRDNGGYQSNVVVFTQHVRTTAH